MRALAMPRRLGATAVRRALLVCAAALVALAAPAAFAQEDVAARVARIADVQGLLYHAPPDRGDDWTEIGQNFPIADGDNLWVARDGRAEVDYGGGQFRLAGDTNLHVSRLDERRLALFIAAGRVIVRVRTLEPDDAVRFDTPATHIEFARPRALPKSTWPKTVPSTTVVVPRKSRGTSRSPFGKQTFACRGKVPAPSPGVFKRSHWKIPFSPPVIKRLFKPGEG